MDNIILQVFMRYLHIVSAIVAVGGMAFILLCLTPAVRLLDDQFRESLLKLVHARFLRVVWASIAGLVVSGVYNWMMLADTYKKMGPKGNALIGTKVLLAVILFAVVAARSLGMIQNQRRVLMINIHLAAIVILLGSLLRYYRLDYLMSHLISLP
jgi:uncharacterized membrane protein